MLRDYIIVTSLILKNSFRRLEKDRSKTIAIAIIAGLGILSLLGLVSAGVYKLTPVFIDAGIFTELLVIVLTSSQVVVFFFGIFSILSHMFFSEDAEFLASLPVRKSVIFSSKLFLVYINELLISTLLLLPLLITMGVSAYNYGQAIGAAYYILILFAVIFIPLIPLLLVSLFAFPMMYVVSFFKKRAFLSTIVAIGLFVILYMFYFSFMGNLSDPGDIEIGAGFISGIQRLAQVMFFNMMLVRAMLLEGSFILNFGGFVLTLIVMTAISVTISSMLYHRGVMSQLESPRSVNSKGKIESQRSVIWAVLIKDVKMLIRNPSFAFQSLMGAVLTPVLVYFMSGMYKGVEAEGELAFSSLGVTALLLLFVTFLLCGTNYVAIVAFTRDGKYFYFNKYLPIPYKNLISSKLNFAIITGMFGVVLSTIVYAIRVDVSIWNIILFFVGLTVINYAFCCMGIFRDIKKPKLDWNNVQEAIKQNFYAMFPMLIAFIIGIAIMISGLIIDSIQIRSFVKWGLLWLIVFLSGIIIMVYYRQKLKNYYVEYINRVIC